MMAGNWYPHYPGDYARKTGHLSLVEHGAYRTLLDHYYATATPLPTDVERTLRVCRATSAVERAAVISVLNEFFVEQNDGWHHARADEELKKAAEKREKCASAGQKSATKRQRTFNGRSTDVGTDVGTDEPTDRPTKGQPTTTTTTVSSLRSDTSANAPVLPDWVPRPEWEAFVEHRRKLKAGLSHHAIKLAISELSKLREHGHDPGEVINNSILNGWKGLFPPRGQDEINGKRKTAHDKFLAGARAFIEECDAGDPDEIASGQDFGDSSEPLGHPLLPA